jgi:hypothetical protein
MLKSGLSPDPTPLNPGVAHPQIGVCIGPISLSLSNNNKDWPRNGGCYVL